MVFDGASAEEVKDHRANRAASNARGAEGNAPRSAAAPAVEDKASVVSDMAEPVGSARSRLKG